MKPKVCGLQMDIARKQFDLALHNELIEQGIIPCNYPALLAGSDFHTRQFVKEFYKAYSEYDWFDQDGRIIRDIPDLCVADCSHPGPCDTEVNEWKNYLNFNVPRNHAMRYLQGFGAWSESELNQKLTTDLSDIVLWIACGEIKESGEWLGLID